MLRDFRHAFRTVLREPGVSVACIASLALAIGLATTVFTAVNSVLLRPLDLPQPDRLALLWGVERKGDIRSVVSFADFEDWRKNTHAFESAAAYTSYYKPVLTGHGPPERLSTLCVSHEYFNVMKAKPAIGRFFRPEEDWDGQDDEVVLSYSFWRDTFRGNPNIVGHTILLSGRPHLVVGIAGRDLNPLPRSLGGEWPQIYRPVGEERGEKSRDGRHLQTIVRLRPGATIAQAQAELNVLCRNMERLHPDTDAHLAVRIVAMKDDLTRNLRGGLLGLQISVLAVLLIACANIANLLLARSASRLGELAVRTALGASAWRIARMLIAESLVLSCTGGVAGWLLAGWGSSLLRLMSAKVFPDAKDFPLDSHVLAFSAFLSIGTGLLFGVAPIWQAVSARIEEALRDGGRSVAGTRKQILRHLLVASQIAITMALLISAGLLTRSFLRLRAANPGFDARGVLTAGMNLPRGRYKSDASRVEFIRRLLPGLQKLPGVSHAALVTPLPLSGDFDTTGIDIQGHMTPAGERASPDRYVVTPDYFAAVKIPLLEGRLFDERDDASHKNVALVSRTAARVLWPGESPIGKKFRAGAVSGDWDHAPFREIVGVVGDIEQYRLGMPLRPQIYMPHAQFADAYVNLILRTDGDPANLAAPLRRAVFAADREEPIYDVIPFESLIRDSIAARRFAIWVLGAFALGALALAMVGVYGVISYGVAQRKQEFGIRMALGARPADVLREALTAAFPMIALGSIIGLGTAFAATKLLASFLFGVSSTDLTSFVALPLAMLAVALIACYIPARRASETEPVEALKYE
ncbi:MAG: ABC transporter permease [Acidobacteriaceae bacterium]|nr:ABC transporter permease [Acidobacteriaceae bacterium]